MKILFFLAALANVVLLMWELKFGAFMHNDNNFSLGDEQIMLVSELYISSAPAEEPVLNVDFTSLYPSGLDPLADNFLTEQPVLEDFIDDLSTSDEAQNEMIFSSRP